MSTMMAAAALSWRLLRAGGRRGAATLVLACTGFAVATLLLVLVVSTWSGLGTRAERVAWRVPAPVSSAAAAVAVQRTTTTAFDGRDVVVVDLAATAATGTTRADEPPPPPGLPRFPAPGEVYLSPALARDVARHPGAELGSRFGDANGQVTGQVGRAGLAHAQELVAVIGHQAGDETMTAPAWHDQRRPEAYAGPTPVSDFHGRQVSGGTAQQYQSFAAVALALLVVPLLVLAGAAARLGLARRSQRLAGLRLAGATPHQVLVVTAVEAALSAAAGALVGILAALAVIPAVALVPVAGGRWYAQDLLPPPPALVSVVLTVLVLAVGSALVALRPVLTSPLGVAGSHTPRRMSPLRLVLFTGLLVAFLRFTRSDDASVTGVVLLLVGVFAALALVGPWVLGLLGRVVLHRSRDVAAMLAGRRLLDDPRGSWRVVGAVAMTGFVAGVLALFPTGAAAVTWGAPDQLDIAVPAAAAPGVAAALQQELTAAGIAARVSDTGGGRGSLLALRARDQQTRVVTVLVPGAGRDLDAARTVVARVAPGSVSATGSDVVIAEAHFVEDFRTGTVLVLAVSFLIAAVSAGITSAAAVLDRRRTYRQLALVGVPLRILDRARALETQVPLVVLAIGSSAAGVVVASPLTRLGLGGAGGGLDASGFVLLLGCLALGVGAVAAGSAVSRPLLSRVAADPASATD